MPNAILWMQVPQGPLRDSVSQVCIVAMAVMLHIKGKHIMKAPLPMPLPLNSGSFFVPGMSSYEDVSLGGLMSFPLRQYQGVHLCQVSY